MDASTGGLHACTQGTYRTLRLVRWCLEVTTARSCCKNGTHSCRLSKHPGGKVQLTLGVFQEHRVWQPIKLVHPMGQRRKRSRLTIQKGESSITHQLLCSLGHPTGLHDTLGHVLPSQICIISNHMMTLSLFVPSQ